MKKQSRRGFTLIEISIVLVIIGLIVGGILVGREMIRSAELNSIATDVNKYRTAVSAFKLKYGYLPGDMPNATDYWGAISSGCTNQTSTTKTTCNGDGNELLDSLASTTTNESYRAWQHLSNAELIPGNYIGGATSGNYTHEIGTNLPGSKIDGGTFFMSYMSQTLACGPVSYSFTGTNTICFAGATTTDMIPLLSILSPIETYSIDVKLDDGRGNRGTVLGRIGSSPTGSCATVGNYILTNSERACIISFQL